MALVSPKRKSAPPIGEKPAHATVMESHSGIDAGKERDFALEEAFDSQTRSSLHRNLRAGRQAPIHLPGACSPRGGFPLTGAKLIHSAFNLRFPPLLRRAHCPRFPPDDQLEATKFLG